MDLGARMGAKISLKPNSAIEGEAFAVLVTGFNKTFAPVIRAKLLGYLFSYVLALLHRLEFIFPFSQFRWRIDKDTETQMVKSEGNVWQQSFVGTRGTRPITFAIAGQDFTFIQSISTLPDLSINTSVEDIANWKKAVKLKPENGESTSN